MTSALDKLGRRVAGLEELVRDLARQPRLGNSSIEGGGVDIYNNDGTLSGRIGQQWDGTSVATTFNGPPPPQPTSPAVDPIINGFKIRYDGTFTGGPLIVAPMDFSHYEVHVSTDLGMSGLLFSTLKGTINTARGAEIVVNTGPSDTGFYVCIVARTVSGKASVPSPLAGPFLPDKVVSADLGFDIADLAGSTISRGPDAPETPKYGDLWLETPENIPYQWTPAPDRWEPVRDAGVSQAITDAFTAQLTADGKVRVFSQPTAPTGLTADDVDDVWIKTDAGNKMHTWSGTAWVARQYGNEAIEPASLVASSVLVTGSVTAALLQAILVLASTIIAGDPDGQHARMDPNGFHVFAEDPVDNIPNEVVRMGTNSNDFFAIVNSAGQQMAGIDDTGGVACQRVSTEQITLGGSDLGDLIAARSGGQVGWFAGTPSSAIGPIYNRYGVAEVGAPMYAGRAYEISYSLSFYGNVAGDEIRVHFIENHGAEGNMVGQPGAPSVTFTPWRVPHVETAHLANRWYPITGSVIFYPPTSTRYRHAIAVERGEGSALGTVYIPPSLVEITIKDIGPIRPLSGSFTAAGGTLQSGGSGSTPVSTPQEYIYELEPAGWLSYRGDGSQRTDVTGPVQGWDPSGFNGDGGGFWWFNLPSITGTVNWVDFYAYSEHWYYSAGGTAIFNIIPGGVNNNFEAFQLSPFGDWHVGGFVRGGGQRVGLPADWRPYFRNGGTAGGSPGNRAVGISVGRSGGTNLQYYGRFHGASARLFISFTQ